MQASADIEDKTGKHPVTPGDIVPARELLGDMLMQMNKPNEAFIAYKQSLLKTPNRFNGIYGACMAASQAGNKMEARSYASQLSKINKSTTSQRPELALVKKMVG